MPRPTVICHMVTSLDGRLLPQRWPCDGAALMDLYEGTADELGASGWIVGRRTMEDYLHAAEPALAQTPRPRTDRIAARGQGSLAIVFDRGGRLRPESGMVDDDHLVVVLSERVGEAHVADLVARGASVVFAGPDGADLAGALERIGAAFESEKLILEGGGTLNGAFLDAGLIDETSTLVLPVIDGGRDVPAIYERRDGAAMALALISAETCAGGTVWLRHRVRGAA